MHLACSASELYENRIRTKGRNSALFENISVRIFHAMQYLPSRDRDNDIPRYENVYKCSSILGRSRPNRDGWQIQLNIDYPTTSGQTTVRRCSDKANVLDKKKLSLTHFQWLLLAARPFYFLLFKIFVFFEWLTKCTVRTLRQVRPKKLLRIIEWSDSRCADNRCETVC